MRALFFSGLIVLMSGLFGMVAPARAKAADNGSKEATPQAWTWERCLAEAKKSNLDYLAAEASFLAAEKQIRVSQSGYFPNLSASLTYANDSTPLKSYGASLNASQNLFAGFVDQAKVKQSEASRDIAKAALVAARAKVSSDLKTAFVNLLYAQRYVDLTDNIIERRQNNLRLVELRFQSGRENRGSLLLSKAYLEQSRLEVLQAKNAIHTSRAQLAKAMGSDVIETLVVQGEVPGLASEDSPDFSRLALQTPDYLQAQGSECVAEAARQVAKASFFPSLNLTGSTGVTGPEWAPTNNRWSVGANLTMPLWSGGKEIASFQAAEESARAAGFGRGATLQLVISKLRQSFASFQESAQKSLADQAFLDAALVRSKIARTKYNNGLMTFDDWDLIENDLITREKIRLTGLRDKVISEASWEQAQGKGALE